MRANPEAGFWSVFVGAKVNDKVEHPARCGIAPPMAGHSILYSLASSGTKSVTIICLGQQLLAGSSGSLRFASERGLAPGKDLAVSLLLSYPYGRIGPSSLG